MPNRPECPAGAAKALPLWPQPADRRPFCDPPTGNIKIHTPSFALSEFKVSALSEAAMASSVTAPNTRVRTFNDLLRRHRIGGQVVLTLACLRLGSTYSC